MVGALRPGEDVVEDVDHDGHLLLDVLAARPTTVLLVTHDVEEALVLSDRVVVLGTPPEGGPAGIQEILTVDSPRPRHRDDPELTGARRHLLGLLGVEA